MMDDVLCNVLMLIKLVLGCLSRLCEFFLFKKGLLTCLLYFRFVNGCEEKVYYTFYKDFNRLEHYSIVQR